VVFQATETGGLSEYPNQSADCLFLWVHSHGDDCAV